MAQWDHLHLLIVLLLSESAYLYVGDGYLDKDGRRFVPALYIDKIRFVENSNRVEHEERVEGKRGKEKQ